MAQIIDEDAHVAAGLHDYLESIGIATCGLDYHIVSIIGAQSSGKSTLLNHLFSTHFATMNESTGRQQTTKGIHAAFGEKLLVFDVEGSDSRERGDADSLFERKAALFALAMSEVVMVNMWQNDIGRYNASSIPLLKTVFEVNLQLFAVNTNAKCHLLFVIRDSTNDVKVIEGQVRRDLDLIWNQLTLPKSLAGRPFEDFFVFHFFPLPHFRLMREAFDKSVVELHAQFVDPQSPDYLFKEHTGKVIPGDGLYHYIHSVWDAITENKELNLPSQRRTLSTFRCDMFAKAALEEFQKKVDEEIEGHIDDEVLDFGSVAKKLIDEAIADYNEKSERYVEDIVAEKRKDTIAKMGEILQPYFSRLAHRCRDQALRKFEEALSVEVKLTEREHWLQDMQEAETEAIASLERGISNLIINDFPWEFDMSDFKPGLDMKVEDKLKELITALEKDVYQSNLGPYQEIIDATLRKAEPNMWSTARKLMKEMIHKCDTEIKTRLELNAPESVPTGEVTKLIHRQTYQRVLTAKEYVPTKMKDTFDSIFLRDSEGNVREWKDDSVNISELFEQARDAGLSILKMFSVCQLREPGEKIPALDVLTQRAIQPMMYQTWEQKFADESERKYIDAVRVREANRVRVHIPWPMVAMFIIFGYDKIFFAIKHPFWALVILLWLGAVYYLYSNKYLDKPIQEVVKFTAKAVAWAITLARGGAKAKPTRRKKGIRKSGSAMQLPDLEKPIPTPERLKRRKSPAQKSPKAFGATQTLPRGMLRNVSAHEEAPPERPSHAKRPKRTTSTKVVIQPPA